MKDGSAKTVNAGAAGGMWTALHFAAFGGHTSIARLLLQAGANPELLSHENEASTASDRALGRGLTPLGCATERGWGETAAMLEQHADNELASMMAQVGQLIKPAIEGRDAVLAARAQAAAALDVAEALSGHDKLNVVRYPTHKAHHHHCQQKSLF